MNYVLTGSTGHITKPLAEKLIASGHTVTIITSNPSNIPAIEKIGGTAKAGSVEDIHFLTTAFSGADAVYLMIPPKWTVTDWLGYQKIVADNYLAAVKANKVRNVVLLSSVGAHMKKGAGPIDGLAYMEEIFNQTKDINVLALRPSYFYYNLFSMIPLIKNAGIIGGTQSADHKIILTHTNDIAEAVSDALLKLDFAKKVQYIASEESSWAEVAAALGKSIGKPSLPWVEFTDEQSLNGMLQAGLGKAIAEGYVQMGKAMRSKELEADYWRNRPEKLGKVKLADFAGEFNAAFNA